MKKKKIDKNLIQQLGIAFAISLALVSIALILPTQTMSFSCDIDGIEYVKLENNASCWDDRFHDDYCPMPERIQCNGFVRTSQITLYSLV